MNSAGRLSEPQQRRSLRRGSYFLVGMDVGSFGIDPDIQLRNVKLFEVHIRRTWLALTLARRACYVVLIVLCLHAAYCAKKACSAVFSVQLFGTSVPAVQAMRSSFDQSAPGQLYHGCSAKFVNQDTMHGASTSDCETCDLASAQLAEKPCTNACANSPPGTGLDSSGVYGCAVEATRGTRTRAVLRLLEALKYATLWALRGFLPLWIFFGMGIYRAFLLDSQLYVIRLNRVLSRFHIVFSRSARRLHKAERYASRAQHPSSWTYAEQRIARPPESERLEHRADRGKLQRTS